MIFEQIMCGGDRNFAYLIGDEDTGNGVLVDPAYGVPELLARAEEVGLKITHVFNTHEHYDHVDGNDEVCRATGAVVVGNSPASNIVVNDGDVVTVDGLDLNIIYTPGHTMHGICILIEHKLITGDTLFVGKVGGTGYDEDARQEYDSLQNKLMILPDETEVYPGHDVGAQPSSTIGYEREHNPFILQDDFESFLNLKKNWLQYKQKHGIA